MTPGIPGYNRSSTDVENRCHAAAIIMTAENKGPAPDGDRLRELAYLSSAVAHHVINGFCAAVSNAEMIRAPASAPIEPSELAALGDAIVDRSLAASEVARRLIDWARRVTAIDNDRKGRQSQAVDLNQLIRELIESEKSSAGARVDWVLNLDPIPAIRGDAAQLRAMLGYLAQNAREALPSGSGTVVFSTLIDPRSWVVIAIHDSGCGMSPEVLNRATEPFFSTKPDHHGAGLTIAHGIWRRHHGAFSIESRPGHGTTIRLSMTTFPPDHPVDPTTPSIRPTESPPPPTNTVANPPTS
jgi:two-component system NtrC family sensor kinase